MADDENPAASNTRSSVGRSETEEPSSAAAVQSAKPANTSTRTATTAAILRKASANSLAMSPAAGMSPRTSRNNSPIRKDKPPPLAGPLSTQPSAAAIQRALSSSSAPQLQHTNSASETATSRLSRGQKGGSVSGESSPQWPISPRVKSPPPSSVPLRKNSAPVPKKSEPGTAPSITVQSATPQSAASISPPAKAGGTDTSKSDQIPIQTPKAPTRGPGGKSTLETVQENSGDSIMEPSPAAVLAAADLRPLTRISQEDLRQLRRDRSRTDLEKHVLAGESGSESAGNRSDHRRGRRPSSNNPSSSGQRPKQANSKNSYSTMSSAKGRQSDAKQNMTVETETVQSIPQSALTTSDRHDHSGSVKLKASTETIRPKKERKKVERKARSVNQGTAPTKADLFEARVAHAVDENSSDSDETFVYESNPPEHQRRQRHHSRTPSVTSSHSIAEQSRGSIRHHDDRRVGGKRSMKFSSVYSDVDAHDGKDGTVRSHTPRHIGRFGRGGHHSANHEPDSPFTKMRNNQLSAQRQPRATSPGSPPMAPYRPSALFFGREQKPVFDLEAEGADDERTPLMNSHRPHRHLRSPRIHRAPGGSLHCISESHSHMDGRSRWCSGRTSACLLTMVMVVLVMVSAFGFVFSSNRPLYDVKIRKIQNVLATEQELMFDLVVSAVNPNALSISANDLDVDIFAKSKYVSGGHKKDDGTQTPDPRRTPRLRRHDLLTTDVDYNPNPSQDPSGHWQPPDSAGHDHGTDPDPDLEKDILTIPLGSIAHFDQSLSFEASPLKRHAHETIGSLRLKRPGNHTTASTSSFVLAAAAPAVGDDGDPGNAELWVKMLEHPFELIVRGVLRYPLPISARWQNAAVSGAVTVHPEEGVDRSGSMRVEPVDRLGRWEWVEWPDDGEDS